MSKLAVMAAGLAVVPMLAFAAPVFADSPGDLAGGADIYQVRNVTKNTAYGSTVSATCNEVVKYSVKLSNTDFGKLTDIVVKASLASGEMTATAKTAENGTTSTSGKVTVTLDKGTLSYIAGSTKVYDVNGGFIKDVADGITANGANVGDLNGSTREFVQFQAKVNCPEAPKAPEAPKQPEAPKAPEAPKPTPTQPTPEVLPNTGAGEVAGVFAATTVAGAVAHRLWTRRFTRG